MDSIGAPATPQQLATYNQSIGQHESRLRSLMNQIMSSPYLPSREQTIQLMTTVITMLLMVMLGPAAATQAGLVNSVVRQMVPLVVAASVHYAADSAVPIKTDVPLGAAALAHQPIEPVHSSRAQLGRLGHGL